MDGGVPPGSESHSGSRATTEAMTSVTVLPPKACRPVSISSSTPPKAQTSVRLSTSWPLACSGLM